MNKENRESSVKKWRGIVEDLKAGLPVYIWSACGFCHEYDPYPIPDVEECNCPLYTNEVDGIKICVSSSKFESHVRIANEGIDDMDKALKSALIVLEAVKTL